MHLGTTVAAFEDLKATYQSQVLGITHILQRARRLALRIGERIRYMRRRLLKYGLTPQQFEEIFKKQEGRCAICRRATLLHIDHNHKTGKVRGLLCYTCNSALGCVNDDPSLLSKAIDYLVQHD